MARMIVIERRRQVVREASGVASAPTAQEDTVLRWHEGCSVLTVTPVVALQADATGWPEGRQLFVRLVLGAEASVPKGVKQIGYGALQMNTTYQATAWCVGGTIYLSPIVAEEGGQAVGGQ